jgi:diguanylate cyclase (GGDEF)-like protein
MAMIAARVLLGLCAWLALGLAAPAFAAVPDHWITLENACHAVGVTPPAGQDGHMPAQFSCTPDPRDYQHGSLWIKVNAGTLAQAGANPVLMVHSSRFDALRVGFSMPMAASIGRAWSAATMVRAGAWVARSPSFRQTAMRRYRAWSCALIVSSAPMLRMRLIDGGQAQLQATAMASMIGAALMLLALGAVYNFGLAIAVRRQFPAWQGAWATCMVAWGQCGRSSISFPAGPCWRRFRAGLHRAFVPGDLAGHVQPADRARSRSRAQVARPRDAGGGDHLLRAGRAAQRHAQRADGILGRPAGHSRAAAAGAGGLVPDRCVAARQCAGQGFRRAWAVPMIVMGSSGIIDVSHAFWGGGSQMMVLAASSWQTVWLAVAATRRFMGMRIERDRALVAEAAAQEQARRDPLTGLRNRRGFLEAIAPLLDRVNEAGGPAMDEGDTVALLLLDVDRFKMINDSHGHEAGDAVLVTLARRLARWDGALCISARLGGEEFALLTSGMGRFATLQLAESVRAGLGACDHGAIMGPGEVTVSIGVALARPCDDFAALYRTADAALYAAKHQGRNRVVIAPDVVYAESEQGLVMPRIASID